VAPIPRHLLVAGSTWASRIVTAASAFVSIRLLTDGLGEERFAAYAILAGLIGWFALADFGVASALQNRVTQLRSRGESSGPVVVYTIHLLAQIWVPLAIALWLTAPYLAGTLIRTPAISNGEAQTAYSIAACLLSVAGLGNVAYRVWYGEQRGYLANAASMVASLLGVWALVLTTRQGETTSLPRAVAAGLGGPAVVGALALGWVYFRARNEVQRSTRVERGELRRKALEFFAFNLMATLVLHMDVLVISQELEAPEVALYSVLRRFYDIGQVLYAAVLLAVWPTWTELAARSEWDLAGKYLRRYLGIGMVGAAVLALAMLVAGPALTSILAPSLALAPSPGLLLVLGGIGIARVWTTTWAVALQSLDEVRPLWLATPVQAIINLVLQVGFARRWGLEGLLVGLLASSLLTNAWFLPWTLAGVVRKKAAHVA
jgi:O-antigen/teichoic acid export membrane protein